MPRTNIRTATVSVGDSAYEKLDAHASNVLTILATGRDLYVCAGQPDLGSASDADSFFLPNGFALEMQPVPLSEIYVKSSSAGPISLWYA